MKLFKKNAPYMLILLLLFTISCQSMGTTNSSDYYAGKRAGEIAAKADALRYRCIDYPVALSHMTRRNIKAHMGSSEQSPSESYIRGFKWGYRMAFKDLTNLYCGGDSFADRFMP